MSLPCPLCGGSGHRGSWEADGVVFLRCSGCGLWRQDPQPLPAAIVARYGDEYLAYETARHLEYRGIALRSLARGRPSSRGRLGSGPAGRRRRRRRWEGRRYCDPTVGHAGDRLRDRSAAVGVRRGGLGDSRHRGGGHRWRPTPARPSGSTCVKGRSRRLGLRSAPSTPWSRPT
ncbi:MAG: hypothetical protein M0C28_26260 [Candidatus Moduliflexus flocculans]|nr:hypothetical protein [Candidatus Moduliflexus flocculans]